ncbi:MAG: MMPL family transporter [Fervidobacterium sp.]
MLKQTIQFLESFKFTIISSLLLMLSIILILDYARIETRIETFLPGYKPGRPITEIDDPAVQNMIRMSLKFGDKENISIIYKSKVPLSIQGSLKELRRLQSKIERLENVKVVISILNYPGADVYIENDSLKLSQLPEYMKTFVSEDGYYAMLLAIVAVNGQVEPIVRKITAKLKNEPVVVLSEASVNNKLFDELRRSMFFYPAAMFFVILLIFFYQTQCIRAAIVSLFIPILASIYTYAIYFSVGGVVNILTAMVPSFLIIIGSAYPLHYYNATFRSDDVRKHISVPIFLSMLTTAIGFMSFVFVKIPAFREFGILVSIGLLIDFVLTITVGHELLHFAKVKSKRMPKTFGIRYFGHKVAIFILALTVILVFSSFFLIPKIKVGLTSTDYFAKNSDINRGYKILEEKFKMRDSIYIVLEKKTGVFLPFDNYNLDKIISELSKSKYISSIDFPRNVPVTVLVLASRTQPMLKHYIADGRTIRLSVNLTTEGNENLEKVSQLISEVLKQYSYNYYLAGAPFIWKAVNDNILISQIQSLVAALIIVFMTILVVFRDFLESLKLVLPVVFATVLNFVYMSLFRMKLEISTALTSSIIIGLAIDYSIHIGHDYNKSNNILTSVKNVGPAIVGNALGIVGGFLTLLFGGELALFKRISILVSLGITTATILTLTMLPFMLSFGQIKEKLKILKSARRKKI